MSAYPILYADINVLSIFARGSRCSHRTNADRRRVDGSSFRRLRFGIFFCFDAAAASRICIIAESIINNLFTLAFGNLCSARNAHSTQFSFNTVNTGISSL